jgi:hypothetical protein
MRDIILLLYLEGQTPVGRSTAAGLAHPVCADTSPLTVPAHCTTRLQWSLVEHRLQSVLTLMKAECMKRCFELSVHIVMVPHRWGQRPRQRCTRMSRKDLHICRDHFSTTNLGKTIMDYVQQCEVSARA